jgi:hypothetical protein
MTKIIWVRGGLVDNTQLAEAIDSIPQRECLIVKVESVQEAIVELFEGVGEVALIICDRVLDMSMPQQELYQIASRKNIPYLLAGKEEMYRKCDDIANIPKGMFETREFKRLPKTAVDKLLSLLSIKDVGDETIERAIPCCGANAG